MREGSKKYTEGMLLKRKRRRGEGGEEEKREKERLPGQVPEPPRIHLHKNGFRCQSKHSLMMQEGGLLTCLPLIPPQQRRNLKFCKIPLVAWGVPSSHAPSRT